MGKIGKPFIILVIMMLMLIIPGCDSEQSKINLIDNTNVSPKYLSFFSLDSLSGNDVAKYWCEAFNVEYSQKIYINFEGAEYYGENGESYRELLEKRLKSSSPDDLYIINAEDVIEFGEKGYWMDLSSMNFVKNLSNAALYQSTYDGKVFSLPLSFTGFGFLWNVDLLEKYGLTIPTKLSEFKNVCKTLKRAGILPYGANKGYALTVPTMGVGFSKLYGSSNQEEQINALNNYETKISEYIRDGYEFLQWMIDNEYMNPEQALNSLPQKDDMKMFLNEECAFICVGMGNMQDYDPSFSWKLTGLPVLENGSITVYGANNRLCVNPNSKNLDVITKFVELLGTPGLLDKSARLDYSLSTSKYSETRDYYNEQSLADLLQQSGQIPNQDFSLHFNTWENIRNVAREICEGISVDEACVIIDQIHLDRINEYRSL